MRRGARILARVATGIAVVVVLIVLGITIVLNSQLAARKIIGLALAMPGAKGVHIAEIRGPIRGPLFLGGITYDAGGIHAEVDSAIIRWKPTKLLLGRIELARLAVRGVRVVLPDSVPADTLATAPGRKPSLPLPVWLGDVSVRDIQISAPGDVAFHADSMRLTGRAQDYGFSLSGTLTSTQTGLAPVGLTGTGDLEHIELTSASAGLFGGDLTGTGKVAWWPMTTWVLTMQADSLHTERIHAALRTWPGRVGGRLVTAGVMDSTGIRGNARIDSLRGTIRGQPLSGHGGIGFGKRHLALSNLDLRWGSTSLAADGVVDDTIALGYDVVIGNLRTVSPAAGGTLHLQGAATGPLDNARIQARLEGSNIRSGSNRIAAIRGRADIELGPAGRNEAQLRGSRAVIVGGRFDSVNVDLRGSRLAHRLTARLRGPSDTIRLAASGGLRERTWRGTLDSAVVRTPTTGGWRLEQSAALVASPAAGRIQQVCFAGDTTGERLCAQGDWRGMRNWNVIASLQGFPAGRLSPAHSRFLDRGNRVAGTIGGNLEAHATAGLVNGNLQVHADTVLLLYQGKDRKEQRLALDSAMINVVSDRASTRTTMAFRVVDEKDKEQLSLTGTATLPPYRVGERLSRQSIDVRVNGLVPDVSFVQPLLFGIDSVAGRMVLAATATGTINTPVVNARLGFEQLGLGLPGRRAVGGSATLELATTKGPDGGLQGQARFSTRGAGYDYWYFDGSRRLNLDSASVVVQVGDQGLVGDLGVGMSDRQGGLVGNLIAHLSLPQYHTLGEPLAAQPFSGKLEARIPDLRVLQPFVLRVDSLMGNMNLQLSADGRLDAPRLDGTLRLTDFGGGFPSGTRAHGDLNGDLRFAVLPDRRIDGVLKLAPEDATITIPGGDVPRTIHLDGTLADIGAGPSGVQGTMDLALHDSTGSALATLKGNVALPGLTRVGEPLARQPIRGKLDGRAEDLAFLAALTRQVDSAAGSAHAEATLTGTLSDSRVVGSFAITDGAVRLPALGILIEQIQFRGSGDQNGEIAVHATMQSGGGDLTIDGTTPMIPSAQHPGRLEVRGNRFEAMDTPLLHMLITPNLNARMALDSIAVRGEVAVPLAHLEIDEPPHTAIKPSDDVFVVDSAGAVSPHRPFSGQVRLVLGDSVSFSALNFDAEITGALTMAETGRRYPTAVGTLRIEEGSYQAYGQDLTIRNGEIRYTGGPIDNPGLAISATRSAQEGADTIVAGIRITGTAKSPEVKLFSTPAMSETQVLSYLLTGGAASGGGTGGSLLNRTLTSLGLRGGNLLAAAFGHQVGLQEATISTQNDVKGAALQIGRYIAPNLYVSYAIGVFDPISTLRLRYVLSNHITLLAETGRVSGADVLIRKQADKP